MRQSTSWCLYSHGEFLGVLIHNFDIFQPTWRSPIHKYRGEITALFSGSPDIDILGILDKSIYVFLFYWPIQGFSGVMRSCMFFSPVYTSIWRSKFIIVCLSARPFLVSVGKLDTPPVCLQPILTWLASIHYCLFLQEFFQNLGILAKPWVFFLIFRVPNSVFNVLHLQRRLRSCWQIFFHYSDVFQRGFDVCFCWISAISDLGIHFRNPSLRVLSSLTVSNE